MATVESNRPGGPERDPRRRRNNGRHQIPPHMRRRANAAAARKASAPQEESEFALPQVLQAVAERDGLVAPEMEIKSEFRTAITFLSLFNKKSFYPRDPLMRERLKPDTQESLFVNTLLTSYNKGIKKAVYEATNEYFDQEEYFSPEIRAQAAATVLAADLNPKRHPDADLFLTKVQQDFDTEGVTSTMDLDVALKHLLLYFAHSPQNSFSYNRIDEVTGQVRPTTMPFQPKYIKEFLSAFYFVSPEQRQELSPEELKRLETDLENRRQAIINDSLIITKGQVLPNPARLIFSTFKDQYASFKDEFETFKTGLLTQVQLEREKIQRQKAAAKSKELAKQVASDLERIGSVLSDEDKKVFGSFIQGADLRELKEMRKDPSVSGIDFERALMERLRARMSSDAMRKIAFGLKKCVQGLVEMTDSARTSLQAILIKSGTWAGMEWLEKWRAHLQGKQHIQKTGADYVSEEAPRDLLAEEEERLRKQEDMRRAKLLLGGTSDDSSWLEKHRQERASFTKNMEKVMNALAQRVHLEELLDASLTEEEWDAVPEVLQNVLHEVFERYSTMTILAIKDKFLGVAERFARQDNDEESLKAAQRAWMKIEFGYNEVVRLMDANFNFTFKDAADALLAKLQEEARKKRENSAAYQFQNRAAGAYKKNVNGL